LENSDTNNHICGNTIATKQGEVAPKQGELPSTSRDDCEPHDAHTDVES
jgi:hypothetical protein